MSKILLFLTIGLAVTMCLQSVSSAEQDIKCATTLTTKLVFKTGNELKHALKNDHEIQQFFECYTIHHKAETPRISTMIASDGVAASTTSSSFISPPPSLSASSPSSTTITESSKHTISSSAVMTSHPTSTAEMIHPCTFATESDCYGTNIIKTSSWLREFNGILTRGWKGSYTCENITYSFVLIDEKQDYHSANLSCNDIGGIPAAVIMRQENICSWVVKAVVKYLQDYSSPENEGVWVGLDALNNNATWTWADGVRFNSSTTSWKHGKPNSNTVGQSCAYLVIHNGSKLTSANCNQTNSVLCEIVDPASSNSQ